MSQGKHEQSTVFLQALREYQSDTFDDWRDLLEEQERRTRDELDASKVYQGCFTDLVMLTTIDLLTSVLHATW